MNCQKCGKCCRKFEASLDLENEKNKQALDLIKKHFAEGKMKMILKEYKKIGFFIEGPCQHLDGKTGLCKIYRQRPDICKTFYCDKIRGISSTHN